MATHSKKRKVVEPKNITEEFTDFINHLPSNTKIEKIKLAIAFIKENEYTILYNNSNYETIIVTDQDDDIRFSLSKHVEPSTFYDLSINIEDKPELRRKNLSYLLIASTVYGILKYGQIETNQWLFIDEDASWEVVNGESKSFWDFIGMVKNPRYEWENRTEDTREGKNCIETSDTSSVDNHDCEGDGYDKQIRFNELSRWAFGYTADELLGVIYRGGGRKRLTYRRKTLKRSKAHKRSSKAHKRSSVHKRRSVHKKRSVHKRTHRRK